MNTGFSMPGGRFLIASLAAVVFMQTMVCAAGPSQQAVEPRQRDGYSPESKVIVDAHSIIQLVFGLNPEVVSARYAMQAAEFQFKDFQRNLSQFTPLVLRGNIERDYRRPDIGSPVHDQQYSTRVGMEKEFFDGSSVFTGVGHRGSFGDPETGQSQFVETDIIFPLFGSNTTLRRITDRSREENEMFNSRLEYIDTVRDTIQEAQVRYFWLLVSLEVKSRLIESLDDYRLILETARVQSDPADKKHLEGEIQDLQWEILRTDERTNSRVLRLQLAIGLEDLDLSQVSVMDMHAEEYYGQPYVSRKRDELLAEANRNDVKIRVLENARENSIEKRKLADKGKWDVFVDINGQLDVNGQGRLRDENGYLMSVGLRIKKIDSTLLYYSRSRAVAEMNKYEALMDKQRLKTMNRIDREWTITKSRREQIAKLVETIDSRRQVYLQKRQDYLDGKETIDNLIASRTHFRWARNNLTYSLGEFYESVTWLDHACGVCFAKVGISL